MTDPSGTAYQIEIEIVLDGKPNGDVRLLEAIDDGAWRAFRPLTSDLLIRRIQQGNETTNTNNAVSAMAWGLVLLANSLFVQQSTQTALADMPSTKLTGMVELPARQKLLSSESIPSAVISTQVLDDT